MSDKNYKAKAVAFARAFVLDNMTKSDAYRVAYPDTTLDARGVSNKADRLFNTQRVQQEIARLKDDCKKAEIITRNDLLNGVKNLLEVSEKNAYIKMPNSDNILLNPKAADIYIKAIDRAAKLIGADEPDKVENKIVVHLDEGVSKYAH